MVILGLVSPPSGVSGNTYSYVYHFVSGSGDGFYSNVEDYNLRATLFASATQDSNKQLIDFSDSNAVFQYKFTNNKLTENRIGTVFDPLPNLSLIHIYAVGDKIALFETEKTVVGIAANPLIFTMDGDSDLQNGGPLDTIVYLDSSTISMTCLLYTSVCKVSLP